MATLSTQNNQPPAGLSSNNNALIKSQLAALSGNGNDQLATLLPLTWTSGGQTISFPATIFKEESSHDLAIHKYPNVDAGRIENTGRNPSTFHIRAILTNNIFPGPNETWVHGSLYPQVFNNLETSFLADSRNVNPGVLQHPFLGNVNCRVHSWTYEFAGKGPRDGVYMDINFVETISQEDLIITVSAYADPQPQAQLSVISGNLDHEVNGTTIPNNGLSGNNFPIPLSPPGLDYTGFFSAVSTQISNFSAYPNQPMPAINFSMFTSPNTSLAGTSNQGQVQFNTNKGTVLNATVNNQATYNLEAQKSLYSATYNLNNSLSNNPVQLINNTINFYTALLVYYKSFNVVETSNMELYLLQAIQYAQQILNTLATNSNGYTISQYVVNVDTSLVALSRLLNNTIDQLLSLNTNMENYLVVQNTVISYYQN